MKKINFDGALQTVVNVGVGGIANALIDLGVEKIDFLSKQSETAINWGKVLAGAVAGTLITGKGKGARIGHAAADGVALVGASNIAKSLIDGWVGGSETASATGRVPFIGAPGKMGNRKFRRAVRGTGTIAGQPFMSK